MKKIITILAILFITKNINSQCTANFAFTNVGNGTINFTSTSVGTTSNTGYYWTFGDGTFYNVLNNINASHTYSNNQTYSVTLWVIDSIGNNCTSNITQTLSISNASCFASVSFNMAKDSLQMPAIVWNAYPTYPINITAANWSWGDGSNTLGLYPSHTYSAAGMYSICVSITVACGSTATICNNTNVWKSANPNQNAIAVINVINASPTAIKKINTEPVDFKLFPNPNNGEFELIIGNIKNYSEVLIYDVIGQKVYQNTETLSDSSINKKINLSELSNGTYFIRVNSETGAHHSKFIINK